MSQRVASLLRFLLFFLVISQACAQDVRIQEFMASNVRGIRDEDGTLQGWIEIWNPSVTKVSLQNWSLTNGTTSWLFPAVEILPDDRILIWASGKNRRVITAPLHTNFTLSKAGGTLRLLRNGGSVANPTYSPYPAQNDDVSYGVDFAAPNVFGAYTDPTPGEPNNFTGSGVAGKVSFSKASSAITASFQLTLTQASPVAGAVIRYTTNGSIPITSSTQYVNPINVNTTMVVRARVFATGLLAGETETAGYLFVDATTSGFSSPMSIFVVTNFGAGTPPDTVDQPSFMWLWEPAAPDNRARFTNAPKLTGRTVIDRRGSSTLGNAKHNVNVEFRRSRDDNDRDVAILGMAQGSDFVLSGPFNFDRSDLHNPLAFSLSRAINRYAPDSRQVEVFFDTNGGPLNAPGGNTNDYFGIYNLLEKIRRDGDRVDVHNLEVYDNDAVAKTGGYIWKIDRRDSGDSGFAAGGYTGLGTSSTGPTYYYPKEIELFAPQRDPQEQYLTSYVNGMYAALQSATWNNPTTGYAAWLDVPACIDHHLLNVWTFNVDALRLSGYWSKERGGKLAAGPIWDFDRALSSTDGRDANPATWRSQSGDLGTDFFNFPWWNRLFADIEFYQKYIDRWQELRQGTLSQTNVNALINTLAATVKDEAVTRDVARWNFPKRSWTSPFTGTVYPASQAAEIQRLKDYLQQRANFFDSQWVGPVTVTPNGGNVSPGQQVTMTGPVGATIYYTLDGIDPRPTGGAAPPGGSALTYSGPITINATTRIRARAYKANHTALIGTNNPPLISRWSGLRNERYSTDTLAAAGNLVVTEINYHPTDPTAAELVTNPLFSDKDFEFLEVKNIGSTPLDLGGASFTSGVNFTFSGNNAITLAPGASAVVAANPQAFAARYGTAITPVGPFGGDLSNEGEKLVVKATNGSTILNFTYDGEYYGADGGGATLVVYDALAVGGTYGTEANWRSSAAAGGSPGANEPNLPPFVAVDPNVNGNVTGAALAATVADDCQPDPPNAITLAWSQEGGPGTAMFESPNASATNVTFTEPGIYVLRLTASDGSFSGFGEASVFAKDTAEAWLARHPDIGGLDEDFDQDGWNNYFEFSQGLDPTIPDAAAGPVPVIEGGCLALTYSRIKPPSTVRYAIEVADAPGAFRAPNPGEINEVILFDTGITQTVKVVDTVSTAAQPNRFLRLKVSPAS